MVGIFGSKSARIASGAIASAAVALSLFVLAPMSAHAETPGDTSSDGIVELTPNSTLGDNSAQITAALEDLEGTQTEAEIDALRDLPFTTFLADEHGNYVAAVNTSPLNLKGASSRAISWLSPGCGSSGSDTGMCLKTTAFQNFGYIGKGIKNVSISNVTNVTAGSYVGSVTTSAKNIYVLKAWQGVVFPAQKVTKITRG